ncbi:MAG TPA: glycosyltransferase family 4 protein [Polyangiaceae bacterium]|nr:glycosyltransferase family 4 protein [Polyangiaceae bacterium]
MTAKLGILFLQSHERFGADAAIHAHLMRGLSRERFEVHLACTQGTGAEPPASARALKSIPGLRFRPTQFVPGLHGLRTHGLLTGLRTARAFPADFRDLVRYVRANRIRLIHSGDHPRDAVYNVLLGRLTGAKSVVHVHVKWATHYSRLAQWAVRSSDAIFSISRYVTGTVLSVAGRKPEDVFTVLNCVAVDSWDPDTDGSAIRREFAIAADAPLIISISRLFSWKGQRELLRGFAGARAELPQLKLLIVGADETEVERGSFTAELRQLAEQLGVAEHVVFTGQRSDIPQLLAACDVFTLPSFEEPFGLVFLEAMAMRRPVVALDNGGTPEVVEHGQSGLLSAPGDIPGLTRNIVTLLKDPKLRARMGEHGRARVLQYFNAERMTADAVAAYEQILSR